MNDKINEFINKYEDQRRDLFLQIESLLHDQVEGLERKLAYGALKYYKDKRYIYLGYWKGGVSIYPGDCPAQHHFRQSYPELKTGKGTIRLEPGKAIPWEGIKQLLREVFY